MDETTDFLVATGVQRLRPATTRVFSGTYSLLHCQIEGGDLFRAVFAVRLLPVSYPDRYVSLRYTDVTDDKVKEIGVIEDLSEFPADQQDLVRRNLAQQYHELLLERIYDIRCEYGQLFFDVLTQLGRREFVMPWRGDRAEDYGTGGKVLLDGLDNRYIIPDVAALPAKDRRVFTSYIYW
jgi:hypothetical protein